MKDFQLCVPSEPSGTRLFSTRLALVGEPERAIQAVVADLQEELDLRGFSERPRVRWDDRSRCVIVEVEHENSAPQSAGQTMYEEIFGVANAVLGPYEWMRVDILEVRERET